ncbi:MAG: glycosyltransferase WbuB [Micrococcaceae bacterium]|nr:glycosyltransferase WbuB [Micrococcaceae bacterium]
MSRTGTRTSQRPGSSGPRIMLVTHSYWPEHSPPQRRWTNFVAEFVGAGWAVDVVTPVAHFPEGRRSLARRQAGEPFRAQRGEYGERILRVPYLRHDGHSRLSRFIDQMFSAAMSVPVALLRHRPDVVLVTAPSLPTLGAGFVLAKLRGAPLVVEMRDAWPDLARDARLVEGSVKGVAERVVEFIQHRANLVVTVTEGFAATLRARGVQHVVTVSNGVDLDSLPHLQPPPLERSTFEALYLGNHGESQRLESLIRASALVGDSMHLRFVGHGTQRPKLMELARELQAPVTFYPSLQGEDVIERYAAADTCIVSLRDDWKSFETTVPSKTYEVLAIGRHVTAVVLGEAERIVRESGAGDVVPSQPEAIAALWRELAVDRGRLIGNGAGRQWVKEHADYGRLSVQYLDHLAALLNTGRGRRRFFRTEGNRMGPGRTAAE